MNNQPMQFMQLAPMRKDTSQQQLMQGILQAALSRPAPGAAPAAPAQGATLPGGAMNLVPPPRPGQMGLLSRLFAGAQPLQPGAPMPQPMGSQDAIY